MKILLTNSGRRTYFIDFIKNLKFGNIELYLSDSNYYVPTACQVNKSNFLSLPISSKKKEYKKKLKKFILNKKIDLVIPLSDYDLNILCSLQKELNKKTKFIISPQKVINICVNKIKTYLFLKLNNFDTPKIYTTINNIKKFPIIIKDINGNGSNNLKVIKKRAHLNKILNKNKNFIIQEFINGDEYNLDILNNKKKEFIDCSIKKKLLMRAGETDRCKIIFDKKLFNLGKRLSNCLGHVGNIDVDLILRDNKYFIIDINPRFGGGYPFTHLSGQNYIEFLIKNFFYKNNYFKQKKRNLGFYSKGISIHKL